MPKRLYLYVCANTISLYSCSRQLLQFSTTIALTDNHGLAELSKTLRSSSQARLRILVNLAEENLVNEAIPALSGQDRTTVIQRKIQQHFYNAVFSAYESQGIHRQQRKEEDILFAALHGCDALTTVSAIVEETDPQIEGIYTLSSLTPALLQQLKIQNEHYMLLTMQDQSLRQSYIKNGHLKFSRLIPLDQRDIASTAQQFAYEATKLQQYLIGQRLLQRDTHITAYLLAHTDYHSNLIAACPTSTALSFEILDAESCYRSLQIPTSLSLHHNESIFLHLLHKKPPKLQFAPLSWRKGFIVSRIKKWWISICLVSLVICTLQSFWLWHNTQATAKNTEAMRQQAKSASATFKSLNSALPDSPLFAKNYVNQHEFASRLGAFEKNSLIPDKQLMLISQALEAEPSILLDSLQWQILAPAPSPQLSRQKQAAIKSLPSDQEPSGRVRITLNGSIDNANNASARYALNQLEHFIHRLKEQPSLHIEISQRPLDIEPEKSFHDSTLRNENNRRNPFTLHTTGTLSQ